VMVPSRDERRARRGTERRGVELRVAKPALGDPLEGGRRDRPAERTAGAEADIISQDDQNVRRVLRSLNGLGEIALRVLDRTPDDPLEGLFRAWQDVLVVR